VKRDLNGILNALFTGLRRLEYRGYDSAGIAVDVIDAYPYTSGVPGHHTPTSSAQLSTLSAGGASSASESNTATIYKENGTHNDLKPLIIKEVGKVDALERLARETVSKEAIELERQFQNQVAISHTRWATHGPPSAINSHPHVSDPDSEFTVVHNGIITNYKLLKDFLVRAPARVAAAAPSPLGH
jgi:glucosamine--fructose-6-phosphate aminotransferase (isomerizing)